MKFIPTITQVNRLKTWHILGLIWLVGAVCDRIWLLLDHSVPAWDATNHLTGSLNYLNALQKVNIFSGEWWQQLWNLSSKYPPLLYILTAPFQILFGTGHEQALLVNLLFSAILLASVYGLGKHLFNTQVGIWAAGLCILLPRLYTMRLHYLHDYPLTALVAASFFCLTVWRDALTKCERWRWAFGFGACFGLAMMVKQTVLFFLFIPLLSLFITHIKKRAWGRIAQLIGGLLLSAFIFGPWYRINWIFLFSAYQNAIIVPGTEEGDPPLNTLAAWTYYWNDLPRAVSLPLLLVPLVGLLLYWILSWPIFRNRIKGAESNILVRQEFRIQESGDSRNSNSNTQTPNPKSTLPCRWLIRFLIASYLICSANFNKDTRYIMPMLPILSVILAYGLTVWPRRLRIVPWVTVGLAFLLMCLNLFPIGGKPGTYLTQMLSPRAQMYPELAAKWPHTEIVAEIIRTTPQLKATVGVLPRLPQMNHNNFNYYGALSKFQVYGREVGTRKKFVPLDARALSWFITKTGNQISPKEAQMMLVQKVEQSPDFRVQKTWNLPDGSLLQLYHRIQPPVEVKAIPQTLTQVKLKRVTLPPETPPGKPVPVTYEWFGPWEQLRSGIVLLSWKRDSSVELFSAKEDVRSQELYEVGVDYFENEPQRHRVHRGDDRNRSEKEIREVMKVVLGSEVEKEMEMEVKTTRNNLKSQIPSPKSTRWLHDHGIGLGELYPGRLKGKQSQSSFQVIETTAMLPPADIAPGIYTLEAIYLNRETGENYPIIVPSVTLNINPNAQALSAPELDLVTQLRTLTASLPEGRKALDRIFDEIGRINQYDPVQDYTVQAERALDFRLQQEPQNRDFAYGLAFSNVLQKDAKGAIAALKRVVQLDAQNPYAHAYLAFLYLYEWRGGDAENAIEPAVKINPNIPEVKALYGVAALMQGNVFKAWDILKGLKF